MSPEIEFHRREKGNENKKDILRTTTKTSLHPKTQRHMSFP